jgi:hypothetical protein
VRRITFRLAAFLLTILPTSLSAAGTPSQGGSNSVYGKELPVVGRFMTGRAMDLAIAGHTLYALVDGKLVTADISDPAKPKPLGSIAMPGGRQIALGDGVACVSARGNGVSIFDVSRPEHPQLLSRYNADVRTPTGVAVAGNVMALSLAGIELVDISDPRHPVHLSTTARGDEVQSVAFHNGYLYGGIHGAQKMVVIDVHNARKPVVLTYVELDGFGDGVHAAGRYCYVATGHYSRNARDRSRNLTPDQPGWGIGHGLEIYDVSSPEKPVLAGRVKFPPFVIIGPDWWDVTVAGKYAYVVDGINGVFVIDVSDPTHPRCVAHNEFTCDKPWRMPCFPSEQPSLKTELRDYASSAVVTRNHLYVAGLNTGINVLRATGIAHDPEPDQGIVPAIVPAEAGTEDPRVVYHPAGRVNSIAFAADIAFVAAGCDGLHVLQPQPTVKRLRQYPTEGLALDVRACRDLVLVAEGAEGLSIWRNRGQGTLDLIGRYRAKGDAWVKRVVFPPPGKYALIEVGESSVHIVDVSDPTRPSFQLEASHGTLYGDQIVDGLMDGRYAMAFWHASGLYRYDLSGPKPVEADVINPGPFGGMSQGVILLGDRLLISQGGGYHLVDRGETRSFKELHRYGVSKVHGAAKPWLHGSMLYFTDRQTGQVGIVDVSQIEKPRLVDTFVLDGSPLRVEVHGDHAFIPAGYLGLVSIPVPQPASK